MSKEITVIVIGVWLIILPYLGIPGSWRTVLLVLTGLFLCGFGAFLRAGGMARGHKRSSVQSFVESAPVPMKSKVDE